MYKNLKTEMKKNIILCSYLLWLKGGIGHSHPHSTNVHQTVPSDPSLYRQYNHSVVMWIIGTKIIIITLMLTKKINYDVLISLFVRDSHVHVHACIVH